jgi:urea carboxylase
MAGPLQQQPHRRPPVGPKPRWARADGGEAGLHPSNIHDNPYAIGAVDFTGDMPIILGPDGPSLGGFVCPFVVIAADRWKIGQLVPGDKIRFAPVNVEDATVANAVQRRMIATGTVQSVPPDRSRRSRRPRRDSRNPAVRAPSIASRATGISWSNMADRARHRAAHPRACPDDRAGTARSARRHRHRARHPLAAAPFRRRKCWTSGAALAMLIAAEERLGDLEDFTIPRASSICR